MIAHTECTTYCLDELSKLTKLLSLLGQSVTDEKADLDDIEGCLGIAWVWLILFIKHSVKPFRGLNKNENLQRSHPGA